MTAGSFQERHREFSRWLCSAYTYQERAQRRLRLLGLAKLISSTQSISDDTNVLGARLTRAVQALRRLPLE